MAKPKTNVEGFQYVLDRINKNQLAQILGLQRQAITNWGPEVPERYAVRVSAITGVPVDLILPETYAAAKEAAKKHRAAPA